MPDLQFYILAFVNIAHFFPAEKGELLFNFKSSKKKVFPFRNKRKSYYYPKNFKCLTNRTTKGNIYLAF